MPEAKNFLTDIEIARRAKLKPIYEIAETAGIGEKYIEPYGKYKAKIDLSFLRDNAGKKDGRLVLVTAISPTPAGEGKTTTAIGLADGLRRIGKNAVAALREPSLGPVFGIKGGAAGGGYAQVVPMEDINLHFTGDFHAVGAANNLLAAMLDNHIQQGNALNIDVRKITWRRCVDMNDRQLRNIVDGLGGKTNGTPREDGFDITVASEVMAVLCLASSLSDLKERLKKIVVAYDTNDRPVTCGDLKAAGAMTVLLKDALKPNLVQTLENNPVLVHGGPFANIAHGCNSVRATKLALKLGDYAITEAGFGSDLGAEKFFDIKCRKAGLSPDCVVVVATVRALKYNGGVAKADLNLENLEALRKGSVNLKAHVENMRKFGVPVVVAINRFPSDTEAELRVIDDCCREMDVPYALSEVFAKGGKGGIRLAETVLDVLEHSKSNFAPIYPLDRSLKEKIGIIAKEIYGAAGVEYSTRAEKSLKEIEGMGFGGLPVCMAKTQYSLSDDPTLLGRPEGFTLHVSEVRLSAGAGFVVVQTGDIMTMPGLPKVPAAERIDIDESGVITGLF